jgi:signal transduction histidine kinase
VPLTFALLGLAAWLTGALWLASFRGSYIPMAPSTAIAFTLVSVALITLTQSAGPIAREVVRAAALLVFVLAAIKVVEFVSGITILNLEAALIAQPGRFGTVPLARMSPVTAVTLALCGVALGSLAGAAMTAVSRHVGGVLGVLIGLTGTTVVLGYSYGAPLLYGGAVIPMALTTGIAFMGTGVALVAAAGPTALPLRPFCEGAARAELAETLHRELQERSTYALGAAGAGIWQVDLASGTMHWSDLIGPMFGLPAEPIQTTLHGFLERVHADDRAIVETALAHSVDTDTPFGVLFRAVGADGGMRWIAAKGHVVRSEGGAPVTLLGIAMDMSDRKALEQQLEQAQKMESLGRLAGGIAHDFNNILTAILGFSSLLLTDFDPSDPRVFDLAEIQKAGESGQLLTRQLLAFSRQQPIKPTTLDLNDIVTIATGMLRQLVGKGVKLETVLAPGLGPIWADAGQLQQVLVNLAVNARDAMESRGRLLITTYAMDRDEPEPGRNGTAGHQIVLQVTDTGTGMSPETVARSFELFFTTKGPEKGTGLGLSTVYGIVRQRGGSIDVTSAVGQGPRSGCTFPASQRRFWRKLRRLSDVDPTAIMDLRSRFGQTRPSQLPYSRRVVPIGASPSPDTLGTHSRSLE